MIQIPVYVFTGFLDSGKTKFIQDTLADERFNSGERTLVLLFEEGDEELDISEYPHQNVYVEYLDQQTVTASELRQLTKQYDAQRVVAELNGMQIIGDLYSRFPEEWVVAQEVMFADSTTFESYNANMRNLMMDKLVGAQMVVFNRLSPGADIMPFHKIVRAASRRIDILYDYTDGTTQLDEIEDALPFDINAPIITVADDDYAIFYRDITEETEKYQGKTVCFKAQVAKLRKEKNGMFAPGRFVMTCCEDDIQFCGLPCHYPEAETLESRKWIVVAATVSVQRHRLFNGQKGPILTAVSITTDVEPAQPDVATF